MKTLKYRIEDWFEWLAFYIFHHPWKILGAVAVVCALFMYQIPNVVIDATEESFFHKSDRTFIDYEEFKSQFGRDDVVIIGIKPNELFSVKTLSTLKDLHEDLEKEVPYLNDITSLRGITYITGKESELIVEDLMEQWPQNASELEVFKNKVLSRPYYKNLIISENADFTIIAVEADVFVEPTKGYSEKQKMTKKQMNEFVDSIRRIIPKYHSDDFQIFLSGNPVLDQEHVQSIEHDIGIFMTISTILIFALLFIIFRRASGVLIPMTIVGLSLGVVFGLMALMELAISPATQALPPFILAVGIGDSVHVLTLFYRQMAQNQTKEASIIYAMKHSGLAILFTSLTTAGGYLSFSQAGIVPIADLGIITPIGVMLAYCFTVLLIPAFVSIFSFKVSKKNQKARTTSIIDSVLAASADFAVRHPVKILLITACIVVTSAIGAFRLEFSQDMMAWFPDDQPIRVDTAVIDRELNSSVTLEVIVDTKKQGGLYHPDIMNKLEQLNRFAENMTSDGINVAKSTSIVDILKQIHQALNENNPKFYAVPQNKELIAQELFLFETSGTDDLEELVDSQFSKARVTIRFPWSDAADLLPMRDAILEKYQTVFQGQADVTITGSVNLSAQAMIGLIKSMSTSYLIAGIVIGLMMILLLGSIKIGILSMVPNFIPILVTLGLMGFWGLPIDLFTVLLGGVSLGLAVDDTVHFLYNFQRFFQETGDVRESVKMTIDHIGRAILFTTVSIAGGFFVFQSSNMANIANFGLIIGITLIFAFIADLFISPALMAAVFRSKQTSQNPMMQYKTTN
ncbi:MMPL family transporter [bacterium]|nr:MMPL family transporter [bacterium]